MACRTTIYRTLESYGVTAPACRAELSGSPFDALLRWSVVGLTLPPATKKLSSDTINCASAEPRYNVKILVSQSMTILRLLGRNTWWSIRATNSDHVSCDSLDERASRAGRSPPFVACKKSIVEKREKLISQTQPSAPASAWTDMGWHFVYSFNSIGRE